VQPIASRIVLAAVVERSYPEAVMTVVEHRPDGTLAVLGTLDAGG